MNNVKHTHTLPLVLFAITFSSSSDILSPNSVLCSCVAAAMRKSMLEEIERDFEGILTHSI